MPPKPPSTADALHLYGKGLNKGDPISPPLVASSMFHLPGDPQNSASYGRVNNPTWEATEHLLSHMEDAPTVLFPSGMAAISAVLYALLKAGDKILIPADGYYASRVLCDDFLSRMGVEVDQRTTADFEVGGFEGYALVFVETPSNPGLELCDITAICTAVRTAGGISVVDNTTMTPFGQRPLDLGADLVVASDTKAPGGHSDVLAGHVATRDEEIHQRIKDWRRLSGSIPGPYEAWLLHRSLETLELRFRAMCESANIIAARLEKMLSGNVIYPGLSSHPQHALVDGQMFTSGFLIGLTLQSRDAAEMFIDGCTYLRPATSFGGVHSSAECRVRWGDDVAPGFVRLSVGCEPVEELWNAIAESFETAVQAT